ncbi:MAG: SDR family oxidoreductase [Acidobacteriota bacterium]|nr:SDR family oxidoreductase [Acidobacteriota bacterium]MDE3031626.1 SDR family oxidoreductase [Acidobacteriota bacterium]MDE3094130.1 SDR family oxidoreductase [Acidobacteriota bacterium]MDE3138806.1 SDR family oxidoreductase [Acidobacteriota bacterium]MDE3147785.1 SDR family oxidoreductase [Acidobacteriota bacterium]
MRVLFIGGTGIISSACVTESLARGHDVWTLNRGRSVLPVQVPASRALVGDASDASQVRDAIKGLDFDVVIQWTAYVPAQVALDVELYAHVGQYIFISSASAYEKPPSRWLITESTPLANPFWQYSRDKIACEELLMARHLASRFPVTIVRPSLTYGVSQIPVSMGSWERPFTIIDRMRRGAKIIVPGDGTNVWTITHNTDFARGLVGLFGRDEALGEAFHITSDEALTWNRIYALVGEAAGVEPDVLHVPTDAIVAADPSLGGTLWGDKANTAIFDNSKIRTVVPDFVADVPFATGIAETVRWFDADPSRQAIDDEANALFDRIAEVYVDAQRRVSS